MLEADEVLRIADAWRGILRRMAAAVESTLELTSLGVQSMNHSTLSRLVRWTALSGDMTRGLVSANSSGRHRKPADNRRARNRP